MRRFWSIIGKIYSKRGRRIINLVQNGFCFTRGSVIYIENETLK